MNKNLFKKISEEVFYPNLSSFYLTLNDISLLSKYSELCLRKRARICTHQNSNSIIHEMFIVHPRDAYVRPHKHVNKSESMLVLQGEVDFIIFDNNGKIVEKKTMGDFISGKPFYHNMSEPLYHSLNIKTEILVFLEITNGPFDPKLTEFADWAPLNTEETKVKTFQKMLIDFEVKNE
ncbi:WbuC family cupin fold metalloprotein [Silvanigrella sp.]|uniref:WbuC family cupin fold metalloprotein n=1 Tax=Silvanigrella sp. TaxID=2024976 RepID=UPI0037C86DBA